MSIHATNAEVRDILAVLRKAKRMAQQNRRACVVVLSPAGELCVVPHSVRGGTFIERVRP